MAERDAAAVRFPPPLIFVGCLLLGLLADRLLDLPPLPFPWWIGIVLAMAGGALVAAAVGLFRKPGVDPQPWTATTQIVATGIYARSRNPMYLGMALVQLGLALAFGTLMGALFTFVAAGVVGATVIAREEAYLTAKFGAPYRAYCEQVNRWF